MNRVRKEHFFWFIDLQNRLTNKMLRETPLNVQENLAFAIAVSCCVIVRYCQLEVDICANAKSNQNQFFIILA